MIWTGIRASAPVNTSIQATSTSTPSGRARGELPAHVDRVVERGEPGDLRDRRGEVLYREEDAGEEE